MDLKAEFARFGHPTPSSELTPGLEDIVDDYIALNPDPAKLDKHTRQNLDVILEAAKKEGYIKPDGTLSDLWLLFRRESTRADLEAVKAIAEQQRADWETFTPSSLSGENLKAEILSSKPEKVLQSLEYVRWLPVTFESDRNRNFRYHELLRILARAVYQISTWKIEEAEVMTRARM